MRSEEADWPAGATSATASRVFVPPMSPASTCMVRRTQTDAPSKIKRPLPLAERPCERCPLRTRSSDWRPYAGYRFRRLWRLALRGTDGRGAGVEGVPGSVAGQRLVGDTGPHGG